MKWETIVCEAACVVKEAAIKKSTISSIMKSSVKMFSFSKNRDNRSTLSLTFDFLSPLFLALTYFLM